MTTLQMFRRLEYYRHLVRKLYASVYLPFIFQRTLLQSIGTPIGQCLYEHLPEELEIEPLLEYCFYAPIARRVATRSTNAIEPYVHSTADTLIGIGHTGVTAQWRSIRENGLSWHSGSRAVVATAMGGVGFVGKALIELRKRQQKHDPHAIALQDVPAFTSTKQLFKTGHRALLSWLTVTMVTYLCAWMFNRVLQGQMERVFAPDHPINDAMSWYVWLQWYANIVLMVIDVGTYGVYPLKKLNDLRIAHVDVIDTTLQLIQDEVLPELQMKIQNLNRFE